MQTLVKLASLRRLALAASLCTLGACSSLSPQVSSSAADYSTVMEDFSNQVLMVNVLRARDQMPLNFSDLPIIHGSISEQGNLSALALFGGVAGTTARSSLSPSVQFSSSPTFDTSSLNNEAFVLNMLQPVSPAYMESIWHGGYSRELLLNLFVESIRLPSRAEGDSRVFYNNPDAPRASDYQDFQRVIHALAMSGANLRSFTVLDPMGPPLLSEARSASGKAYVPVGSASVYTAMTDLDPALYQVGNVQATTTVRGKPTPVAGFQVYRRNSAQIGLCVDSGRLRTLARQMRAGDASDALAGWLEASADDLDLLAGSTSHTALALYGGRTGGHGATPMSHATKGRAAVSASAGGARASASTLRAEAHAVRTTGILDRARECGTEEHIAGLRSEDDEVKDAARLGYVRWRSPMDVYNYLGALLRNAGDAARTPAWTEVPGGPQHRMFEMLPGRPAAAPGQVLASVNYRGAPYTVIGQMGAASGGEIVHSLQVLSLLSQLVNISKLSSDIPVTRSIEVLP